MALVALAVIEEKIRPHKRNIPVAVVVVLAIAAVVACGIYSYFHEI